MYKNSMITLVILLNAFSAFAQLAPGEIKDMEIGPAKCKTTKTTMKNGKAFGQPEVKSFEGKLQIEISTHGTNIYSGVGGPNGKVGALNFTNQDSQQVLIGKGSSVQEGSHLPAFGWLGKMTNLAHDLEQRKRELTLTKKTLDYKLSVRQENTFYKSSAGYELHSSCTFGSDMALAEVHGLVSTFSHQKASEFNGDRTLVDKGAAKSKGSSKSAIKAQSR